MLLNLALVVIVALFLTYIFEKINLPGLLGMILTGILLGPYTKDIISASILNGFFEKIFISEKLLDMSSELRTAALIVILIRAGLGISKKTLNKVGKPALKMSFIPGIIEGSFIIFATMKFLNFSFVEAGVLAFIIAAVSPAVVVPQMLNLKEKGYGKHKEVPTLILAGASVDDVIAITIFGAFLNIAIGKKQNLINLIGTVPLSIILGVLIGAGIGYLLLKFFKKIEIKDTKKVMIFTIVAILFHSIEEYKLIPVASLIGIMTMGFVILEGSEDIAKKLAEEFSKIWIFAEILLFVLIGAQVNIAVVFDSGLKGLLIITIGLIGRSIGVYVSLMGSELNIKERIFCIIAYIPKATVQAAIGAIPLSYGLATGDLILAIAVLSIVVTAPLGAIGIKLSAPKLLEI